MTHGAPRSPRAESRSFDWQRSAIRHRRHNPIRICAKGFGNEGKGGKVLTHQKGPIMMKWSIWVILEGLQALLVRRSPFLSTHCFVSSPHNSSYATRILDCCGFAVDWEAIPKANPTGMFDQVCVPKVFDNSGMGLRNFMTRAGWINSSLERWSTWHCKCVAVRLGA